MDPQAKSAVTTLVGYLAASLATWAGVSAADGATFGNVTSTVVLWIAASVIAWYKTRSHTPVAQIAAVNDAPNGAKVVAETANAPRISAPVVK